MTERAATDAMAGGASAPAALSAASRFRHGAVALLPLLGTIAALILWSGGKGPGAIEWGLLAGFYLLNMLGMELALHRYFAHGAFKTGPRMRLALAILGSLAYMGPLIWWVAIHRLHHARSDRDGDPHTPRPRGPGLTGRLKGLFHGHVGWLFDPASARAPGWNAQAADLYREPALLRIHLAYDRWLLLGLALPAALGGLLHLSAFGALMGFLWGGTVRIFLATNAVWAVNSLGHAGRGSRPFAARRGGASEHSCNRPLLALLTLGAGWHNNHHAFPALAATGFRWWQADATFALIRLLAHVGLARDLRRPEPETLAAASGKR